jgi:hypothetical protein
MSLRISPLAMAWFTSVYGASDLMLRTFIQLGCAAAERVEGRRDDLFCRHIVDEKQHPGAKGFKRRHGRDEAVRRGRQFPHLGLVDRFYERVTSGKVTVKGSRPNSGFAWRFLRDSPSVGGAG